MSCEIAFLQQGENKSITLFPEVTVGNAASIREARERITKPILLGLERFMREVNPSLVEYITRRDNKYTFSGCVSDTRHMLEGHWLNDNGSEVTLRSDKNKADETFNSLVISHRFSEKTIAKQPYEWLRGLQETVCSYSSIELPIQGKIEYATIKINNRNNSASGDTKMVIRVITEGDQKGEAFRIGTDSQPVQLSPLECERLRDIFGLDPKKLQRYDSATIKLLSQKIKVAALTGTIERENT